jgi:hypothetical protein
MTKGRFLQHGRIGIFENEDTRLAIAPVPIGVFLIEIGPELAST